MICPKCGYEIQDGHLMCEKCGHDIQIVPDYIPDIEKELSDAISDIQLEEKQAETEDDIGDDNPFADETESVVRRKVRLFITLASVIVITLSIFIVVYIQSISVGHQLNKAKTLMTKKNYVQAINLLENCNSSHSQDADVAVLLAEAYVQNEQVEDAENFLEAFIENGMLSEREIGKAYNKLIFIYEKSGKYEKICQLLEACDYDTIVSENQKYLAGNPKFSVESGEYNEVIHLKIMANTTGRIYYTIDGTTPDNSSSIYTAPIFLQSGNYIVSAIFVNDYGMHSEVVTQKYKINVKRPDPPESSIPSGSYNRPTKIVVSSIEECEIFYTSDGSQPDENSVPYTGPIPMPLGSTTFKFVCVNEQGVLSEVTTRNYQLLLKQAITPVNAVNTLVTKLVEKGYLSDYEGHKANTNGQYFYMFSSVIRTVDDKDYYTIEELFDDGTGIRTPTQTIFLVGTHSGQVAKLAYDGTGNYIANPF